MPNDFQLELVRFVPRLRRFALALTNDTSNADDLVQSACVQALRKAGSFRDGTRMDSWLYRIVQNLWIDQPRRSMTRGNECDASEMPLSDPGLAASMPESRLMLETVMRGMGRLPDAQRAALALVAIEGLSYREAAAALDVPVGTVMSRVSRARDALLPLVSD